MSTPSAIATDSARRDRQICPCGFSFRPTEAQPLPFSYEGRLAHAVQHVTVFKSTDEGTRDDLTDLVRWAARDEGVHICSDCLRRLDDLTVDLCRRCAGDTCAECSVRLTETDPEVHCWPCWHDLFDADEVNVRRGEQAVDEGWVA
jgi:hypothetical protein